MVTKKIEKMVNFFRAFGCRVFGGMDLGAG